MAISRDLLAISSGYKHTVSMELKCNNKIVLDYLDEKLEELLSDENLFVKVSVIPANKQHHLS